MKKQTWFYIGFLGILLTTANPTVMRWISDDISMFAFNALRFGVIAIVCSPFIIANLHKFNKQAVKTTLLAASSIAISVAAYAEAIKLSQASYASVIALLSPIILVVLSVRLTHERVKMRSLIGITLAALGAMIIIVMPIALGQGSFTFYPVATLLAVLNAVLFPTSIVFFRKANVVHKISMPALIGIGSLMVVIVNYVLWQTVDGGQAFTWDYSLFWAILYCGIVVGLIAQAVGLLTYEHIGAAKLAPLTYIESIITVLIPVFVLGERLSIYMIFGGILILAGTVVVEYHKATHRKHAKYLHTR